MDKVFSTRLDESVIVLLDELAEARSTSKKKLLEEAIRSMAENTEGCRPADVFARTSGAWRRRESPQRTIDRARSAFRDSMKRGRGK
jgi:hypothetical protein